MHDIAIVLIFPPISDINIIIATVLIFLPISNESKQLSSEHPTHCRARPQPGVAVENSLAEVASTLSANFLVNLVVSCMIEDDGQDR